LIHDSLANERNFIGCLLRSPHELWAVNDVVTADAITIPHHRDIYTAIRDLSERGRQVTITTLQAALPEEYNEIGPTIAVLMALKESAAEAGSATDYAPFIAERAARSGLGRCLNGSRKRPVEENAALRRSPARLPRACRASWRQPRR
jgi:replicative DNA helicase